MATVHCDVCLESFGQSAEAMDDTVLGSQGWACHCRMLKDHCVIDDDLLSGVSDDFVASVVFKRRANVKSGAASEVPRTSGGPLYMRDDSAAWWSHGGGIEVVDTVEVLPC